MTHSTPDPVGEGERLYVRRCPECGWLPDQDRNDADRGPGHPAGHRCPLERIEVVPLADLQAAQEERDRLREATKELEADRTELLDAINALDRRFGVPNLAPEFPNLYSVRTRIETRLARSALTTGTNASRQAPHEQEVEGG